MSRVAIAKRGTTNKMFKYNKKFDKNFNQEYFNKSIIMNRIFLYNKLWNYKKEKIIKKYICEDLEIKNKKIKFKYFVISKGRSKYNSNLNHIYISINVIDIISTIVHEMHHIYFLNNYSDILKNKYGLQEKEIQEIKEIFIFIINQNKYIKITKGEDKTYKDIIDIQNEMFKIWQKGNGIYDFFDQAIPLYKKYIENGEKI